MLKSKLAASLLIGFSFASPSQAASVAYYLDQSNQLADGINYLKVTISDEGKAGVIDFTVEALQPLLDVAGKNFGIQKFAFNILGGVGAEARDVDNLPKHWRAGNGGRMDGFGLFDVKLHKGSSRQDPLTFSITGVDLDTIQSYVELSHGRSPEGFSLFAAQVTGINFGNCKPVDDERRGPSGASSGHGDDGDDGDHGGKCVGSAFFGGVQAVPAPPALWLLGTGIAGLVIRRYRSAR